MLDKNTDIGTFDLGWLVGLFEGEGSISWTHSIRKERKRNYFSVHITIVNTNLELIERILDVVGTGKITPIPKQKDYHKQAYMWRLHRQDDVLWFLEETYPYLIEKKAVAEPVIKFLRSRTASFNNSLPNAERIYKDEEVSLYNDYREIRGLKRFIGGV